MPKKKSSSGSAKSVLACSFCFKEKKDVGKLVAGPSVQICDACIGLCGRIASGKAPAGFSGWKTLGDDELLMTLPGAESAVEGASEKLRELVDALRKRGVSWERIASSLGVSRQAAWERFSSAD